jgi:hypothetical protein
MMPSNSLTFSKSTKNDGFNFVSFNGNDLLITPKEKGWFAFENIDLTGVSYANLMMGWQGDLNYGFSFEARFDTVDGKVIGKGTMPAPKKGQNRGMVVIPIQIDADGKMHDIYFTYTTKDPEKEIQAAVLMVSFTGK